MSMEYENEPRKDKEHSSEEPAPEPEDSEEFSFLQETIKDEPINKKKLAGKIAKITGLGLAFGLAASLGFYAIKPWAETKFQSNPKEVTIPKDEEDQEEKEANANIQEPVTPVLTIDSYRQMSQALTLVAQEADKSVVEVNCVKADEDWMKESYDTENSVSGLIVANNGQQLLILAKSSVLRDAQSLSVTFTDGTKCSIALKKKDENLGIAILSVELKEISESTINQVKVAVLGNSNAIRRGEPVIALGKAFGYSGGFGAGLVSSMKHEAEFADGRYDLICTDIAGAENGTGVLTNLAGEVIGVIDQSVANGSGGNLTTAFAISNLKEEIELLLNGGSVPYTGIVGTEVTDEVLQKEGLPAGIYVKEVQPDSPAMAAGIQRGDVIVSFGKNQTVTVGGYYNALMNEEKGNMIKLKGKRRGANGYVDIEFSVTIGSRE